MSLKTLRFPSDVEEKWVDPDEEQDPPSEDETPHEKYENSCLSLLYFLNQKADDYFCLESIQNPDKRKDIKKELIRLMLIDEDRPKNVEFFDLQYSPTLCHLAILQNCKTVLNKIGEFQILADIDDGFGNTLLDYAETYQNPDMIQYLSNLGMNKKIKF